MKRAACSLAISRSSEPTWLRAPLAVLAEREAGGTAEGRKGRGNGADFTCPLAFAGVPSKPPGKAVGVVGVLGRHIGLTPVDGAAARGDCKNPRTRVIDITARHLPRAAPAPHGLDIKKLPRAGLQRRHDIEIRDGLLAVTRGGTRRQVGMQAGAVRAGKPGRQHLARFDANGAVDFPKGMGYFPHGQVVGLTHRPPQAA